MNPRLIRAFGKLDSMYRNQFQITAKLEFEACWHILITAFDRNTEEWQSSVAEYCKEYVNRCTVKPMQMRDLADSLSYQEAGEFRYFLITHSIPDTKIYIG